MVKKGKLKRGANNDPKFIEKHDSFVHFMNLPSIIEHEAMKKGVYSMILNTLPLS